MENESNDKDTNALMNERSFEDNKQGNLKESENKEKEQTAQLGSSSILVSKKLIEYGDSLILWAGRQHISIIQVKKGEVLVNNKGRFLHDDLIGKTFGCKVV